MTENLLWALLLSWGAGINLYLTLLLAGVAARTHWLSVPASLDFLSTNWALAVAGALFLVEFVADKIPYVDTFWDSIQTFIRVPAGILLAFGAAHELPAQTALLVTVAGGVVCFGNHGAKSTVRLALNSAPEPFTNWFVSLAEDAMVVLGYSLLQRHPRILLGLLIATTVAAWLIVCTLVGIFKRLFRFPRPAELRSNGSKARKNIE